MRERPQYFLLTTTIDHLHPPCLRPLPPFPPRPTTTANVTTRVGIDVISHKRTLAQRMRERPQDFLRTSPAPLDAGTSTRSSRRGEQEVIDLS